MQPTGFRFRPFRVWQSQIFLQRLLRLLQITQCPRLGRASSLAQLLKILDVFLQLCFPLTDIVLVSER